ncbi:hypothetical protein FG475_23305 [Vibrio navarrensis]|nr:hypothetical protein [Vibrio navarrensis]
MEAWSSMATIVGLLSIFKSEKQGRSDQEDKLFMEWLVNNRHEKIKNHIEDNKVLLLGIKSLLSRNHDEVIESLQLVNKSIQSFCFHIEGLSEIAKGIYSTDSLSVQALSILKQMHLSGCMYIVEQKTISIPNYYFQGNGSSGVLTVNERKYLSEDLNTLCEFGLIRDEYIGDTLRYTLSRQGTQFVEKMV